MHSYIAGRSSHSSVQFNNIKLSYYIVQLQKSQMYDFTLRRAPMQTIVCKHGGTTANICHSQPM